MKVAIVYDRVNKWGGAERVLLALHRMFPRAPLYTSVYDKKGAPWAKVFPKIHTSFLQKIPFTRNNHEFLAVFMPLAFESFNFDLFDVVISVTSESAKGIITKGKTKHICICLTPTRYLWSHYNYYFKSPVLRFLTEPYIYYLRKWDKKAAQRPDVIVSISNVVKSRIKKYYNRDAETIYPPVEIKKQKAKSKNTDKKDKYYLYVGRLVGYKSVDLLIKTFNKLGEPLVIVGTGREAKRLKRISSSNITFVGEVNEKDLLTYYLKAKVLIMPQEEDFGIVAVEAQSLGVPVIAYKKGGALDTVIDGKTGILFDRQNSKSLMGALRRFEKKRFVVDNLYTNAKRFGYARFKRELKRLI